MRMRVLVCMCARVCVSMCMFACVCLFVCVFKRVRAYLLYICIIYMCILM